MPKPVNPPHHFEIVTTSIMRLPFPFPPLLLIALIFAATPSNAASGDVVPEVNATNSAMDTRLKTLEADLRCLVCQNQSLADSPSEWADGMRLEIRTKMKEGLSDEQINEFLIARYGDFVTYKPPLKPITYVLWFGPILILLIALGVVVVYVRRRNRSAAPDKLDDEQERLAGSLLDGDKS